MTFEAFLTNLNSRGLFRIRLRLDSIRRVLEVLGHPEQQWPSIHIAGTNGKGSVAASLESVLRACGYRTGLYTSPHLVDLRERVQINGSPLITGFTKIAEDVLQAEAFAKAPLTYFELLTAIAFWSFAQQKVDIGIIECGMGGLWDATNVLERPLLSIITSVGLDHTEWLGKDESLIAVQKAGIIKSGSQVISGVRGKAQRAIRQAVREKNASWLQLDNDFRADLLTTSWRTETQIMRFVSHAGTPITFPFGLLGSFQRDNAALVIASLQQLASMGYSIPPDKRNEGLKAVCWPGRFQLVRNLTSASLLLDGAHNPPAIVRLLESIDTSPYKNLHKTFIFSAFKDKDYQSMARIISGSASSVFICPLSTSRRTGMLSLRRAFSLDPAKVCVCKSAPEALNQATRSTPRDGLIIVTGSLSLIGEVLTHLKSNVSFTSDRKEFVHA